jgi:hypothetical protein
MRKSELQCENMRLLEEEDLYWYKRSHEQRLLKNDNNTEFFHRIANGRKRKNTIFSLQGEDGLVEGDENLVSLETKYYKELFGPSTCFNIPLNRDLWGEEEKVSVNENDSLCKPFSEIEVKYALSQMEHNKVVGPDKIHVEFYQACWDIIKSDIMEFFNDLYKGKLDVSKINYGVITLLPKVVDADKIHQFRPICLLNFLYKWITKVLTIRLTPIAGRLICAERSAFIKGRNIMNGVMVLHEVMHETKRRKETG